MQTSASRYDQTSIVLHWTIALGIIAIAAAEILRGELFARGSVPREVLKALHEPAGTLLLALIVLRLVWRATHAAPALPLGMHDWERSGAKLTHWVLYAFPVLICLSGMATTFARGRSIDFGLFQIASPIQLATSRDVARTVKDVHEWMGEAILVIAFFHASAALWHHYVRKDDVLTRMLPGRPISH